MPLLINWHKYLQPYVGCCWHMREARLIRGIPRYNHYLYRLLGLVHFSAGALSNGILFLRISYVSMCLLASGEVQLPHQRASELPWWQSVSASLAAAEPVRSSWRRSSSYLEMLVFSPSLPLHFVLHAGICHGSKGELWHRAIPLLQTGGWYFMGVQLWFKFSRLHRKLFCPKVRLGSG